MRILRDVCAKVVGIDADKAAASNPFVHDFRLITGLPWPVDDSSIDLCLVDNVLEHVSRPGPFIADAVVS